MVLAPTFAPNEPIWFEKFKNTIFHNSQRTCWISEKLEFRHSRSIFLSPLIHISVQNDFIKVGWIVLLLFPIMLALFLRYDEGSGVIATCFSVSLSLSLCLSVSLSHCDFGPQIKWNVLLSYAAIIFNCADPIYKIQEDNFYRLAPIHCKRCQNGIDHIVLGLCSNSLP